MNLVQPIFILLVSLIISIPSLAQSELNKKEFLEGYAVRNNDTLFCEVLYKPEKDFGNSVTLFVNNHEEITYKPNEEITAFGFIHNGTPQDYSIVSVKIPKETRRNVLFLFARKMVSGYITFYKASYYLVKSSTNRRTGETKKYDPELFTDYLIQKNHDSTFRIPRLLLTSFKKYEIEPYFSDYPDLYKKISQKSTLNELLGYIKEYNNWSLEKKKSP